MKVRGSALEMKAGVVNYFSRGKALLALFERVIIMYNLLRNKTNARSFKVEGSCSLLTPGVNILCLR